MTATQSDAKPLLARLKATRRDVPHAYGPMPFEWFEARVRGLHVVVALNGLDRRTGVDSIATQPAVLNAYVTMLETRPDLVISAGTAGGWAKNATVVGDVYVSDDRLVFHDRRIPIKRFDEYGLGSYPSVDASRLARDLNLRLGIITTGNSLENNDADGHVISEIGAAVKDMEAAGIAYVADLLGVPMLAIKAITDLVDHHETHAEQFAANLALASAKLAESVFWALDWCEGKTIGDLSLRPAR